MGEVLGIRLKPEVLPFSNLAAAQRGVEEIKARMAQPAPKV